MRCCRFRVIPSPANAALPLVVLALLPASPLFPAAGGDHLLRTVPAPAATPASPDADVAAVVRALWAALSHPKGRGADAEALRRLFHPEAVVFGSRPAGAGTKLTVRTAKDFVEGQAAPSPEAFFECEVSRTIRRYDSFATVVSVVESRTAPGKPPIIVGINGLQLARDDSGWKILSLHFHLERPGHAIALDPGRSGGCLSD